MGNIRRIHRNFLTGINTENQAVMVEFSVDVLQLYKLNYLHLFAEILDQYLTIFSSVLRTTDLLHKPHTKKRQPIINLLLGYTRHT